MVRDAAEGDAVAVVFLAVMVLVGLGDEMLLLAGALFALLPPFIIYRTNQRVTGTAAATRNEDNGVAIVAASRLQWLADAIEGSCLSIFGILPALARLDLCARFFSLQVHRTPKDCCARVLSPTRQSNNRPSSPQRH